MKLIYTFFLLLLFQVAFSQEKNADKSIQMSSTEFKEIVVKLIKNKKDKIKKNNPTTLITSTSKKESVSLSSLSNPTSGIEKNNKQIIILKKNNLKEINYKLDQILKNPKTAKKDVEYIHYFKNQIRSNPHDYYQLNKLIDSRLQTLLQNQTPKSTVVESPAAPIRDTLVIVKEIEKQITPKPVAPLPIVIKEPIIVEEPIAPKSQLFTHTLYFEVGKSNIVYPQQITQFIAPLKLQNKNYTIYINGYASPDGSSETNYNLIKKRTLNTVSILENNNIPKNNIQYEFSGISYDENPNEARRVEIKVEVQP